MSSSYGDTAYDASQEQCARCQEKRQDHYAIAVEDEVLTLCNIDKFDAAIAEDNQFQAYDRSLAR